jgi:hypothetical protein
MLTVYSYYVANVSKKCLTMNSAVNIIKSIKET